ncbi:MAG: sigma 54-interacting transcriptional regulator [Sphingorhabdus sp.]
MLHEKLPVTDANAVDRTADRIGRRGISLIGQSATAASLRRMVALAAATDAPLILSGPDGAGKRDVAGAIHAQSDRSAAGFVSVHCAAIDHEVGNSGLFESALGGSVFFDEIGDMEAALHSDLYRLLESRNIRIITATSKSAASLREQNLLAAELCTALSVLNLPVPALTERRRDISLLLEAHIQLLPREMRFTIDRSADEMLRRYDWPGNLSEMQELVTRIARHHAGQRVSARHLAAILRGRGVRPKGFEANVTQRDAKMLEPGFDLQNYLAEEEAKYIGIALAKAGGIVQQAADMTGIKRTTFLAKMKKHGIERKAF